MPYIIAAQQVLSQPYTSMGSPLFATVTAPAAVEAVVPAAVCSVDDSCYMQQQPQQQYDNHQQQYDHYQQLGSACGAHSLTKES
jgi:hypothetical protein